MNNMQFFWKILVLLGFFNQRANQLFYVYLGIRPTKKRIASASSLCPVGTMIAFAIGWMANCLKGILETQTTPPRGY